jgi:hypothetical protein
LTAKHEKKASVIFPKQGFFCALSLTRERVGVRVIISPGNRGFLP